MMTAAETLNKLKQILHDPDKCNAVKFDEMEQIVLKYKAIEGH